MRHKVSCASLAVMVGLLMPKPPKRGGTESKAQATSPGQA